MCVFFNLNLYKFILSGSMLIIIRKVDEFVIKFLDSGIECCIVGEIVEKLSIEFVFKSGEKIYINDLLIDEIYKVV